MKSVPLLFALALSAAPFQCRTNEPPRTEDSAPEAMWNLSEHFRAQNMEDARRETLKRIVDEYPSSREAHQAQLVLDGRELQELPPRGDAGTDAASSASATGSTAAN